MAKKTNTEPAVTTSETSGMNGIKAEITHEPAAEFAMPDKGLMYVGPTLTKYGLTENARYVGGVSEGMKQAIAKLPEFRNLFIPVEDYPKAHEMVRTKSGYIYSAFVKAQGLR